MVFILTLCSRSSGFFPDSGGMFEKGLKQSFHTGVMKQAKVKGKIKGPGFDSIYRPGKGQGVKCNLDQIKDLIEPALGIQKNIQDKNQNQQERRQIPEDPVRYEFPGKT